MLGFGLGLCQLGRTRWPPSRRRTRWCRRSTNCGHRAADRPGHRPAGRTLLIASTWPAWGRLGELAGRLSTAGTSIVLDHHASNSRFGDLPIVEPTAAATSVVAEGLLTRLGVTLDPAIAECLTWR